MKRLSKDQKQQRADLVTRLNDAAEAVRAALAAVHTEIAGKLNSAIENYNLVVSVVEAFRDEIVSKWRTMQAIAVTDGRRAKRATGMKLGNRNGKVWM